MLESRDADKEELRGLGFTAALIVPSTGVLRAGFTSRWRTPRW